ncbi:hypothetical protein Tco_1451598, partial [Tanacetum coccineum]
PKLASSEEPILADLPTLYNILSLSRTLCCNLVQNSINSSSFNQSSPLQSVLPLASNGSLECLDTFSDLVRAIVSPMVSWRLGPPRELVPRELGSLGVALD